VTVHREHKVKRENQQDASNSMFTIKLSISTCFGHHYAHHQENKTVSYCVRCSAWCVGCGWLWSCGAASWAVRAQLTTQLHKMGIMMPETCWDRKFDSKHRITCILLVLSLHLTKINLKRFIFIIYILVRIWRTLAQRDGVAQSNLYKSWEEVAKETE